MKAINLLAEYMHDPIGIDITTPRISWNCRGGVSQTAYRVVAVDEAGQLMWDSGKVESSQMHLIPWGGSVLRSRSRVTYRVTLWDENDVCEESEEASFELGLLGAEDWKAQWITGDYKVDPKKRYPADVFIKEFTTKQGKAIIKARAYTTALGIYEGTINGEKIGDFCLAPGITDYRKRLQYQTADITSLVKAGENRLVFTVADGWFRGSVGAWGMKNYYGDTTGLLAQIEITYEDGSRQTVSTGNTWFWTNKGPVSFADNKDGEHYDARKEGYINTSCCGCAKLLPDKKLKAAQRKPVASNNFPLTEHERFADPEVIITPSGKKVFNFKQNIAGYVEFSLEGKAGEELLLRFGEKLDGAGEFTQKNIQCHNKKITTPLQEVHYIAKDGHNCYKTRFAIFGFQYVEATGMMAEHLSAENITAIAVYSDFDRTFRFGSSNPLLDQFVENTLWSLKNNSADLPTDCPTRERHGWTGDAQIFVNTASYMTSYAPFARKFENDMVDWQDKDGKFPQIAPEGGTDSYMRSMNGSVGWADAGVFIPYRMWKKYQDIRMIEDYYEPMRKFAEFTVSRLGKSSLMSQKTGLKGDEKKYLYNVGQHYGEWAEPKDVHEMKITDMMTTRPEEATAYAAYLFELMTEIAEALGKKEDAARYSDFADKCRKSYQALVHQQGFTLDTDRQAKLVRPLYFGLLSEEDRKYAQKRLVEALDRYGWRIGTGFLSTPLILYVLDEIDVEFAYRLLENEDRPGWLVMPKVGATTIWEDWEGPLSDNGNGGGIASLNHYSKGAVCEWIFDRMCGIRVTGENEFTIAPVPGGHFAHAQMAYDSIFGTVVSGWKKTENGWAFEITIPANTRARVLLPGEEERILTAGTYTLD